MIYRIVDSDTGEFLEEATIQGEFPAIGERLPTPKGVYEIVAIGTPEPDWSKDGTLYQELKVRK